MRALVFFFAFFSSVRSKLILAEDITNPKHASAWFGMIIDFCGCIIN